MPDFDQLKNFVIAKKPTNVFSKTIDSLKGLFATVGMPVDNVGDIAQHGGSWKGLWEKVRSKGLEKGARFSGPSVRQQPCVTRERSGGRQCTHGGLDASLH